MSWSHQFTVPYVSTSTPERKYIKDVPKKKLHTYEYISPFPNATDVVNSSLDATANITVILAGDFN